MGRYYWSKKQEVDYLIKIQVWWLKKYGYLDGWSRGTIKWTDGFSKTESSIGIEVSLLVDSMCLNYTQTGDDGVQENFNYNIPLTTTPCHFGGRRYWFVCPWQVNGEYCGRRVGVLYKSGKYFACRHCYNLTYSSKNKTRSGSFYPFSYLLNGYARAHKLESQIKRNCYAGKPTRKQIRLNNIYRRMVPYAITFNQLEKNELF